MSARITVVLEKRTAVLGGDPVGSRYTASVPSDSGREGSRRRAFAMLKRDKPTENQLCWEVVEAAPADTEMTTPQRHTD